MTDGHGNAAIRKSGNDTGNKSLLHEFPPPDDPEHTETNQCGDYRQEFCEDLGGLNERGTGKIRIDDEGCAEKGKGTEGIKSNRRQGYGDKA